MISDILGVSEIRSSFSLSNEIRVLSSSILIEVVVTAVMVLIVHGNKGIYLLVKIPIVETKFTHNRWSTNNYGIP